jgi:hypothetical protein
VVKIALDRITVASTAGNVASKGGGVYSSFSRGHDRGNAVPHKMIADDEAKFTGLRACDALTVFGDKFPESGEVEDFGRQKLSHHLFLFRSVAHVISFATVH